MTIEERLARLSGRPTLVAIAAMNAITGIAAAVVLAPLTFGSDAEIFRRGAEGIEAGIIAKDFFYAPLFGSLVTPLTWVSAPVAAWSMTLIGLALLLAGVAIETRDMAPIDRVLVAVAALGFIPVVYELLIGQVTLLMAAAVYPVRARDGLTRGVALGVVIGLVPKPMLIPLFAWMLLRRRRALAAALVTAVAVTVAGMAWLGVDLYRAWIAAVVGTGQVTRNGNMALTGIDTPAIELGLIVLASVIALWVISRHEQAGFVAALVVALLVQPFTLAYAISILLLTVRPALAIAPRATRVFALIANPATLVAFVPWAVGVLVACAAATRGRAERDVPASGPGEA